MKKILLILVAFATLASCSKDDDTSNADDQILGKWFLTSISNGESLNLTINDCNKKSYIVFNTDGTAESVFYDSTDGNCIATNSTSAWSKEEGESKYKIAVPVFDLGPQTGRVEFNTDLTAFTFYPDLLSGDNLNTGLTFEKR